MFQTKNEFSGANFDYTSESCTANGEFRYVNSNLECVNINGRYEKDGQTINFIANRDSQGNVNIYGVKSAAIRDIADEVASIIEEIESLNKTE